MRINARLDDEYEEKFHEAQRHTGKTRTEILKEALDDYFQAESEQAEQDALAKNRKIVEMIGGIVKGPEDGSVNYKKYVMDYLDEKYPDR